MQIAFTSETSEDQMNGLHWLPKYLFMGFQYWQSICLRVSSIDKVLRIWNIQFSKNKKTIMISYWKWH